MRRYYTRACNFYYGNESKLLVNKKKSIPLNGNKNISFDQIEIISRVSKRKISIKDINSLAKSLKKKIKLDLKKIKSNYNSISVQNLWGNINLKYKELNIKSPNLCFLIDNENNFRNISKKNILESNLIINFFSTYTIEASILKTPIINYIDDKKINNMNILGDKKNLYLDLRQNHVQRISKRIETAYSFDQLKKLIDLYMSNAKRNKKNIEKFYKSETIQKGNSIFLISNYLNNI